METYRIEHLKFCYPQQEKSALSGLSLSVPAGQFVTLCGPSGCGKSTFLRQLKSVLAPHGAREGQIIFRGKPLDEIDERTQASEIGFVLQSPENQIVTDKVWHELAFGLESLGVKTSEIRRRVAEMASFFGIQNWFHKSVTELSGGQKQLLNLASVMAMQPSVLLLDEPTSQLDPIAAADFLETVHKINRELGVTVILSEHRLEEVLPLSDRVIVMEEGSIIADGSAQEVGRTLSESLHKMFYAMPAAMQIYAGVENDLPCPVTVREGRTWLTEMLETRELKPLAPIEPDETDPATTPAISLKDVWFRYEKHAPDVVKGLSLSIESGSFYAIVGGNGTGKTTTLSLMSGILSPYRGKVLIAGRQLSEISDRQLFDRMLGVLPQNPQALFVKKTVKDDLLEILPSRGVNREENEKKVGKVAQLCRITALLGRHPYDLSGGEQQRAALAKVLLLEPKILLLDEPTKGMDPYFKQEFGAILKSLQASGVTIVMVSHDIAFCAQYADRCAMFFDGTVVSEDSPRRFFSGNSFYTTPANRIARDVLPDAVTVADVILALGGKTPKLEEPPKAEPPQFLNHDDFWEERPPEPDASKKKKKLPKRTVMAALMILLLIPLTIFVGWYYLGDRKYYFISLLVLLETMVPFFLVFEQRKPQARELLIIAVLCALAVAGRLAFYMLPQFKPVTALIIIAGVCFGGESGFLVGAVTAFASNMFIGQGPWTPWQMFAFGIIGFLAGVLFSKGIMSRKKLPLCIFGGLATFFIYGGIVNSASVLMYQAKPVAGMFLLSYLQGIPMDLVHAAGTVVFLWLFARPMMEKLDRVKVKYGLVEP